MRALVALVIIAALLAGGDALVRSIAEGRVEERIARELGGESEIDVALGGFPFTVRALSGRIPSATVTGGDVRRGRLTVDSFTMRLQGVEVALADAAARVESGSGSADIEITSLARFIGRRTELASVSLADDQISATLPSIGRTFTVAIGFSDGRLVIEVPIGEPLTVRLPTLFRGLRYVGLQVTQSAATLRFEMKDARLEAQS